MAYQSTSCLELRAGIARALNMPFQSLFVSGQSQITAGANTYTDSNLTQDNNFWKHQWLFIPSLNHIARITGNTGGVLSVDRFLSFTGSRNYEIYQIFSPVDLLWAINQSIQSSYPYYYDNHFFDYFAYGVSKYPLSVFPNTPAGVRMVYLELPRQPYHAVISNISYANEVVTLTGQFDPVPLQGWVVVVEPPDYKGIPFAGTVQTANSTTITFALPQTVANVLTFQADSRIHYYNPNLSTLMTYSYVKLNRDEFPDDLHLEVQPSYIGLRMKIVYTSIPQAIQFDGSTIVPAGYIIPKSVSLLAASKMMDTRIDTRRWQALIEIYSQQAEQFKQRYPFREGAGDLFINPMHPLSLQEDNPLGW